MPAKATGKIICKKIFTFLSFLLYLELCYTHLYVPRFLVRERGLALLSRSNFKEIEVFSCRDVNSTVHVYDHSQSGGQVVWLENEDLNRAFGIGFMTPPEHSRGCAHIVEHCVLSGSRKYPVKDPFMTMLKTSMTTFLNAMTYADMTIYPVSSLNEQDFHNLMDVYLDAVFFPKMLEQPLIFKQEGWHYTYDEAQDELGITGVVYNEMRGAYSTPDRTVAQQINRALHPMTPYAEDSGGDPYQIPDLTYAAFCDFHRRYYRPDNSLVVLYGDIDIDRALTQIDGDYFSQFSQASGKVKLSAIGSPKVSGIKHCYYNGDGVQTPEKSAYFTYNVPLGLAADRKRVFSLSVLLDYMANAESSPLRQEIVEAGLAQDVSGLLGQNFYLDASLVFEKVNAAHCEVLVSKIEQKLARILAEGLDRNLLEALLNSHEFALREAASNVRGINRVVQVISGWRYDFTVQETVNYSHIYKDLRKQLKTAYYEDLLRETFLDNQSRILLCHEPKEGLFKEKDDALAQALAEKLQGMSAAEIADIKAENAALYDYQTSIDSPEALASLPKLKLSDVKREIAKIPQERHVLSNGQTLLFHPQDTAGIRYLRFAFPLDTVTEEELPLVGDLLTYLGSVDTATRSYQDLDIGLMKCTNGLSIKTYLYEKNDTAHSYLPKLEVCFATLDGEMTQALALVSDILNHSQFKDANRMRNLLQREKMAFDDDAESRGHGLAVDRLRSFVSQAGKMEDLIGGLSHYDHMRTQLADFEAQFATYAARLTALQAKLWDPKRVVLSLTGQRGDDDYIKATIQDIDDFLRGLKPVPEDVHTIPLRFDLAGPHKEAITTSSNVQYVAAGSILDIDEYKLSGSMVVLANILSHNYLHEQIREQGGAYGTGLIMSEISDVIAYSYRDPNLLETIATYEHLPKALEELDLTQAQIEQFIIGSMNRFHYPITPRIVNRLMFKFYFKGESRQSVESKLAQALATTKDDLLAFKSHLAEAMQAGNVVVFGNQEKIAEAVDFFDEVRPLKR